jgi:hypothetical protein
MNCDQELFVPPVSAGELVGSFGFLPWAACRGTRRREMQ